MRLSSWNGLPRDTEQLVFSLEMALIQFFRNIS
jgi:hypothetical protein